jgi:carbon-monoxide dehydrogenase catalytic subunit
MLVHASDLGVKTVWDRHQDLQPLCGFGELGVCCDICYMGPCRIDPFGQRAQTGACGADAHLIVARNLARAVAAGAAAHSDHGREVVAVLRDAGYPIANPAKLRALAAEWGVAAEKKTDGEIAGELASRMAAQFGQQEGVLTPALRAPEEQRRRWSELGIMPR